MWKIQHIPVTQILRVIKFGDSRSAKSKNAIFGPLNFVHLVHFSLQKVQKCIKIKIHTLKMCQIGRFCKSRVPKFDYT